MHIPKPNVAGFNKQQIISDLSILIAQPSARQSPPCPNCTHHEYANMGDCSSNCFNAAAALSEDPEQYPVEPNVLPLVFELTSIRLVQTCWSCEGHANIKGEIWKLPQVSFYSASPFYAQLLSNYLAQMFRDKALHYPWEIVLSNFGQTVQITYTLKCDLSRVEKPCLAFMHQDLFAMGQDLAAQLKNEARLMIEQIKVNRG